MTDSRNSRKVRTGVVTSVSGAKTIVVTITERKRHPKYGKMMTSSKKLHAHDEECTAGVGDTVRVHVHIKEGNRPRYGDPSYVQDEALAPHRGRRAR